MIKVTTNAKEVAESLKKIRLEIEKKMKSMVVGFAYELSTVLSMHTPEGNPGEDATQRYMQYYMDRYEDYGIAIRGGFHAGAWTYGESATTTLDKEIYSLAEVQKNVRAQATSQYKLGDTFYIRNNSPGIVALEHNWSQQTQGEGIMKPSLDMVMTAYAVNMKRYYDAGGK